MRPFDYASLAAGTPFEGHPFFGNESMLHAHMPHPAAFSDLGRILILNKHGGERV